MKASPYSRLFFAPGRINFLGEHLDYNGGWVLPASIDKGIYLSIESHVGDSIILLSDGKSGYFNENSNIDHLPKWLRYPFGVWQEMKIRFPWIQAIKAHISSDLPSGAGLSSSAALCSAFTFALNEIYQCGLNLLEMACLAQKVEHLYIGVNCGIMDQFAIFHGKKDKLIQLDCSDLNYVLHDVQLENCDFILIDSCVKHSLSDSPYNERRASCELGLREIEKVFGKIGFLAKAKVYQLEQVKALLSEKMYRQCLYVLQEQARVEEFLFALRHQDKERIGALISETHLGLKEKYEVSCDETDFLVDFALKDPRALGARMMGGGFGGCTIHLVDRKSIPTYQNDILLAYQKKYNINAKVYPIRIEDGVKEIQT
jgi:galactokinase